MYFFYLWDENQAKRDVYSKKKEAKYGMSLVLESHDRY